MEPLKCCNCGNADCINNDFIYHVKPNGDIICEKCCYHLFLKDYVSPNYIAYDDFLDSANGCFDIEIRENLNYNNDHNKKIFLKVITGCNAHVKFIVNRNYENYANLLFYFRNNCDNKDNIYYKELIKFSEAFQIFNTKCHWLAYNFHKNLKDIDKISFEYY
jgi:hypothetical protein